MTTIRGNEASLQAMSSVISFPPGTSRADKYRLLLPQVDSLMDAAAGPTANMANMSAALKEAFDFHWVGFYLVRGNELVLGPFQGPPACTRIQAGKGVCGTAWLKNEVLVVPDVGLFPGHIACSPFSKSEIVLPVRSGSSVIGVLDIDSDRLDDFSEQDVQGLTSLLNLLEKQL